MDLVDDSGNSTSGGKPLRTRTEFGLLLEDLRRENKHTLTDMAFRLRTARQNLSEIEFGKFDAPASLLDRLRQCYDISDEKFDYLKFAALRCRSKARLERDETRPEIWDLIVFLHHFGKRIDPARITKALEAVKGS